MAAINLPSTPSILLANALRDLEKCEQDSNYRVDMDSWHHPSNPLVDKETFCAVCLTGSVLAQTIGIPITENSSPHSCWVKKRVSDEDFDRLKALDLFRLGQVPQALVLCGKSLFAADFQDEEMPSYSLDAAAFKSALRSLIKRLRDKRL